MAGVKSVPAPARIMHEGFYYNLRYENQNCGILPSRQDHTKRARPRKHGGDALDGGRARRSVGQHTVSSMPRARLAWRLIGFVTNPRAECGLVMNGAAFHINFGAGIDALK